MNIFIVKLNHVNTGILLIYYQSSVDVAICLMMMFFSKFALLMLTSVLFFVKPFVASNHHFQQHRSSNESIIQAEFENLINQIIATHSKLTNYGESADARYLFWAPKMSNQQIQIRYRENLKVLKLLQYKLSERKQIVAHTLSMNSCLDREDIWKKFKKTEGQIKQLCEYIGHAQKKRGNGCLMHTMSIF